MCLREMRVYGRERERERESLDVREWHGNRERKIVFVLVRMSETECGRNR